MSRQVLEVAETKISAGPSRVTGPAELNVMVHAPLRVNQVGSHRIGSPGVNAILVGLVIHSNQSFSFESFINIYFKGRSSRIQVTVY